MSNMQLIEGLAVKMLEFAGAGVVLFIFMAWCFFLYCAITSPAQKECPVCFKPRKQCSMSGKAMRKRLRK